MRTSDDVFEAVLQMAGRNLDPTASAAEASALRKRARDRLERHAGQETAHGLFFAVLRLRGLDARIKFPVF